MRNVLRSRGLNPNFGSMYKRLPVRTFISPYEVGGRFEGSRDAITDRVGGRERVSQRTRVALRSCAREKLSNLERHGTPHETGLGRNAHALAQAHAFRVSAQHAFF